MPTDANRQLIVAQGHGGHRLAYARLLADAARADGRRPTLLLSDAAMGSNEFALHLASLPDDVDILTAPTITPRVIAAESRRHTRYPVVLPEGDEWILPTAAGKLIHPAGVNLLVMRPRGQAPGQLRRAVESIFKAALRGLSRCRRGVRIYSLVGFATPPERWEVPDPATSAADENKAQSRRASWDDDQTQPVRWLGIVGGIGARKNVDLVARAMTHTRHRAGLVLAGSAEVPEETLYEWTQPLRTNRIPVVRIAEQLPDVEFDSIITALDAVVLAHSNEGSSGIFAKAAVSGTRVLAAGALALKRDAELLPHLAVWSRLDEDALAGAIDDCLDLPNPAATADHNRLFSSRLLGIPMEADDHAAPRGRMVS